MPRAGEGDARQMRGMRGWLSACSLEADINAVHRRSAKGLSRHRRAVAGRP